MFLFRVHTLDTKQPNYELSSCLEELFQRLRVHTLAHNGAALGGSFSSGCCTTRCGLRIMNGGSQRHSLSMYVCVFTHWTPNNPELSCCLEEFRELLKWCCTRRIVFERLLHHTLWSRIMNSETLSFNVCLRVHTLDTKQPGTIRCLEEFRELLPTMVLHSADRFRAAAAPHVVVYVFRLLNYEWRESEALSFNVCLRVHTLDTKQP
ncbi:hypothetical protein TcBrA4_0018070 [Trypanosoma cruzi]|nr:hypothetical protein TcBrA4_0018070 [Trypanosoma cruzi]